MKKARAVKLRNKGFTLIELLIVVAIVAILAAIAIPIFHTYKARAYNAEATTDLSNLRITQEALFSDHFEYGGSPVAVGTIVLQGATTSTAASVVLSPGVSAGAKVLNSSGKNISYTAVAKHATGDTAYGTETEVQGLFRLTMPAGTVVTDADVPVATMVVDFVSPWTAIR